MPEIVSSRAVKPVEGPCAKLSPSVEWEDTPVSRWEVGKLCVEWAVAGFCNDWEWGIKLR